MPGFGPCFISAAANGKSTRENNSPIQITPVTLVIHLKATDNTHLNFDLVLEQLISILVIYSSAVDPGAARLIATNLSRASLIHAF